MSEEIKPRPTEIAGDDRNMRGNLHREKDAPEGARSKLKRRKKISYLTINKIETVDFKEINILRRFLNDRGKLLPARQNGNSASQQRMIGQAVRRAREMALLPFVVDERSPDRGGFARRERAPRPERVHDFNQNTEQPETES